MDTTKIARHEAGDPIPTPPLNAASTTGSSSRNTQSSASRDSQTAVGEDSDEERKLLQKRAQQRKILPRDVSDKLEPFEAMPVPLDRFAEALVSFYLLQYPKATYVFNQNLNPHPVYTNFAIAMNAPACFQVILARSALYKMSAGQYGTMLEKAELETAVVEHKTNAIQRIRLLSASKVNDKDELVASIIALGTLDMRMGLTTSADVHYLAVRRLLKGIGGPMFIRDIRLKRVMCFFECIYGTVRNSYIWERADFGEILERFNTYLADIRETWKARSGTPDSTTTAETSQGYPLPETKPPVPMPGKWSTRMPSGPHSPYFGIQPLPEVVPQPKVSPPKVTVSEPEPAALDRNRGVSVSKQPKVPPSKNSAKRTTRQDARLPAKERARQLEKLKGKQNAMQVIEKSPATEVHKEIEMLPPAIPVEKPARPVPRADRCSYWKMSPDTALHRRLSLWTELPEEKKTPALIWDLACLFCLSAIMADYADRDEKSLAAYMSRLSKIVHDANLHVSENNSNMMWLIQTNDSRDEHSRRMWEVAAFTWVCKHLNVNVKRRLREWLFSYLMGEELQRKITLTAFDFSYDSSMS
jgi:hypothetical protein